MSDQPTADLTLAASGQLPTTEAAEFEATAAAQFNLGKAEAVPDLRALLRQRTETKMRRIHRQWFCFDPQVQADLDAATDELAELVGREIQAQQLRRPEPRKYALPTGVQAAEARVIELRARARQVGAMGVFQNLNDEQLDQALARKNGFEKAKAVLSAAWLRWEDADGNTIPADVLGRDDLDMLLQPEVLERGEWLPLAGKISQESQSVVDRPTLPA